MELKKIKKKNILSMILLCILVLSFFTALVNSQANSENGKVIIYFFWGDGCPHCTTEKPYLEEWKNKYPELEVKSFEAWSNPNNYKIFQEVASAYGIQPRGVPTTFIGERNWVGFSSSMASEMESYIQECIEEGCEDLAKDLDFEGEGNKNEGEGDKKNISFNWILLGFVVFLVILIFGIFLKKSKSKEKFEEKEKLKEDKENETG